jgi:hypothetical protein
MSRVQCQLKARIACLENEVSSLKSVIATKSVAGVPHINAISPVFPIFRTKEAYVDVENHPNNVSSCLFFVISWYANSNI